MTRQETIERLVRRVLWRGVSLRMTQLGYLECQDCLRQFETTLGVGNPDLHHDRCIWRMAKEIQA